MLEIILPCSVLIRGGYHYAEKQATGILLMLLAKYLILNWTPD